MGGRWVWLGCALLMACSERGEVDELRGELHETREQLHEAREQLHQARAELEDLRGPDDGDVGDNTETAIDPSTFTLSGVFQVDDAPISTITRRSPTIWIRNERTNKEVETYQFAYDPRSGVYTFSDLPRDPLYISADFNVVQGDRAAPGNYSGSVRPDPSKIEASRLQSFRFPIGQNIHLLQPFDNANPYSPRDTLNKEILFEWEPIDGAAKYYVSIYKNEVVDRKPKSERVKKSTVTTTRYAVSLPPHDGHYSLDIRAYARSGAPMGSLFVRYANHGGLANDYKFEVGTAVASEARALTRAIDNLGGGEVTTKKKRRRKPGGDKCRFKNPAHVNWVTNESLALDKARTSGRGVLVYFTAEWCGPCKAFERKALCSADVVDTIQRDFVPLKFDATKRTKLIRDARRRYKVKGYPTLMVVDWERSERARYKGVRSRQDVLRWLGEMAQAI